jgi:hypothetical protein
LQDGLGCRNWAGRTTRRSRRHDEVCWRLTCEWMREVAELNLFIWKRKISERTHLKKRNSNHHHLAEQSVHPHWRSDLWNPDCVSWKKNWIFKNQQLWIRGGGLIDQEFWPPPITSSWIRQGVSALVSTTR